MKQQSITKNYILNLIYQILALITPLITSPYLSRVFGSEGIGIYSYTNSVATYFAMFAVLGTSTYGQRMIARCRDDRKERSRTFWEIECFTLGMTLVFVILWLLFAGLAGEYRLYYFLLVFQVLGAGMNITWFYAGMEKFSLIVLRNVVVKLATVIAIFVLVRKKEDLWIYIGLLSVSAFLGNLSLWFSLRSHIDRIPFTQWKVKKHIRENIVYFIPTIAASVYTYLDKTMLGIFTSDSSENGYYEQAHRIIILAYTMVISLNTVMSSRISYLFAQKQMEEIRDMLEKALAFILTISIPIALGIAGIADGFVPWFFGEGFEKVSLLLKIGCPLVVILSIHNFLSAQYLVPCGYRAKSTKGVIAGAAVNFVCNMILIPGFQSAGAVVASIIAEITICIIYSKMSREGICGKVYLKYLPSRLMAGGIMVAVILFIQKIEIFTGICLTISQIVIAVGVYFGMLLLVKDQVTMEVREKLLKKCRRGK